MTVSGPFREAGTGPQARPHPDDLVLTRQSGDATQCQRGVDHRQLRPRVAPFDLRGEVLGAAKGLVQQAAGERLGIAPAEVAARDRAGPRRPVEGEDELLAVAVLEIAVVEPGVVGVTNPRRPAAARVVVVVRGEDEPGVAGVLFLRVRHRWLSFPGGWGRRPGTRRTSSGILSASRPAVNGLPARADVENVAERPGRLAQMGGGCGSLCAYEVRQV